MTVPAPAQTGAIRPPVVAASVAKEGPVGDRTRTTRRIVAYVLLIGYAILMLVPFAWSVSTSFKTNADATRQVSFMPDPVTLEGWETAFNELDPALPRLFLNSTVIAVAVTLSNVVLGSMAGYAFARLRFPGRELLFILVLGTMMIPDQLRLVPIYQILRSLGLLQDERQFLGIVVVLAISATSIFLLRQYFLSIPRALEEAAKIDGAGFYTTFARVVLPLATPAIAAVAILQFQGTWNGFFWPVIILQERANWTLPLGIAQFQDLYATQWPPLMAVVVMATIPILILYVFFQRFFVEGIAAAGVKG
ncbi:MAG TPA: carbohydrate ABC transporter permease [Candidatus Limnocylindrales bacterium]|nr:carbohydrate ABC transporter permease [Candidatus Limnocylindrales bacterium]